jgi:hypothetical protein
MSGKFRSEELNEGIKMLGALMGASLQFSLEKVGQINVFRSCASCRNWQEGAGCKKFQALPPVAIIVEGCDAYDDNFEIPF